MIINDLVPSVISKIRQRTELASMVPYYISQVLLDLTENTEFEELKQTGPLANFITQQAEYPIRGYDINGIQGNPFVKATDHRITLIHNWFIYFDTSGVPTPGVSMGTNIDKRDLRVVEPMSKIQGIPTVYTIHGDKINNGRIIVGQMPNNPYACQMRYQREHPFNIPYAMVINSLNNPEIANELAASTIYMPNDWSDIIVYSAAEKMCDDFGMNEIGISYHQKLYGSMDKRGNKLPGLIMSRMVREEKNTTTNSRSMRPVVRRYTG